MNYENNRKRKYGTGIKFKEQQKRKLSGQDYISRKGNVVAAKKPPELDVRKKVICKCYNAGCKKLNNEHKKKMFDHFCSLDLKSQGSFCMTHMHLAEVKRRRHGQYTVPSESRRQASVFYTLPDGSGSIVNVCKRVFMDVLSLSKKKIDVLVTKKKVGDLTFTDKRGSHGNHPKKYTRQDRARVVNYINSIPKDESHYSREKTSKLYLSPDLNLHRLAKGFNKKYPENTVLYKYFCRIFKKEFPNLSFRRPRTDTCKTCDKYACE